MSCSCTGPIISTVDLDPEPHARYAAAVSRVRALSPAPIRGERAFVLYWMIAARRTRSSFALERAIEHAKELRLPLVVFEPLRADYPYASERITGAICAGMADNAARFARSPITYVPYVGAPRGSLSELARDAAVVVTDDYPCFFLPHMVAAAAKKLDVRLEAVDSNGIIPIHAPDREFTTAFSFRAWIQKNIRKYLFEAPKPDPLARLDLPRLKKPPMAGNAPEAPAKKAAHRRLKQFLETDFETYHETRNDPDADTASRLSPHLHFGHISSHEIFAAIAERESWDPATLAARKTGGKRTGFWGMSASAEAFLDQLITWRELGFNFCARRTDYATYGSLPAWARATLEKHASDPRSTIYTRRRLENAETGDELWNAAQRQLVREGRIHNYLRMLWGKKILEWTRSPKEALATMIELNDTYALDGRDPNSYSGIGWVLGRYDRPWGPEREIFGTVRYMSSENTRRKLNVAQYLERWRA